MSIEKMTQEEDFFAREEEILVRKEMWIWYGDTTYDNSLKHLGEISKEIKKDYPMRKYSEMKVNMVAQGESIKHAGQILLKISISPEEYLQLRDAGELKIL